MQPYTFKVIDGEEVAIPNEKYWKQLEQQKYALLLKKSSIPKNYWDIDFTNYKGVKSLDSKQKAEIYAHKCKEEKFHSVNLFLTGGNSTQKSMIACAIGKEFLRQGLRVKFVYAGYLIDLLLKTTGFDYKQDLIDDLKKISSVDLLIIDDIFDSAKSIYWKNSPDLIIGAWDTFLRNFIHEDRRIIVTSNFTVEAIKEKFGESLYQLIARDFLQLFFYDDIKTERRKRLSDDLFVE